jgi:hypothetical protein
MSRARSQRGAKRKQYLEGRAERERLANLPTSWMSPRDRLVLLAVLILLLLGAMAATPWCAVRFASDAASARALQDAPVCTSAPVAHTDCVQDVHVFVDRAWSTEGGSRYPSSYYVTLSGPAPAEGTIQLTAYYWLPTGPDDSGDALVWRGQVVAMLGGDRIETVDAPRLEADRDLNWLVAAALGVVAFLSVLLAMFTRLKHTVWRHALTMPSVLAAGSFAVGAGIGAQPAAFPQLGLLVGGGLFALSGIMTALIVRRLYRNGRFP